MVVAFTKKKKSLQRVFFFSPNFEEKSSTFEFGFWLPIGYMAPEYRTGGVFSMKSDVFSFGVLMLEILSGKRNRGFSNLKGDTSLLTCVRTNLIIRA